MTIFYFVAAVIALVGVGLVFFFWLALFAPWVRSFTSGAPVSIASILGMRLRKTPPKLIIDAYVQLRHRNSAATLADVEKQYLANRHRVRNVGDLVDFVEQNVASAPATA